MTDSEFETLVTRIRNSLGCSKDLAAEYAKKIGDTPEMQNGQILVRNDEGRIITRISGSVLVA